MQTNTTERVRTAEGAPARTINAYLQLRRSVLACLLWENEFYESGANIAARIDGVSRQCDVRQVSNLASEARKRFHLRHVPLLLLVSLMNRAGEFDEETTLADIIYDVIQRPDEMGELISLYWLGGKKPLTRQLKKGLARCFCSFSEYQLAKWDKRRAINLVDVMALVHPKPKDEAQEQLFKRVADCKLMPPNTWESRAASGEDMKQVFENMLKTDAIGYFALLRNLRNMTQYGVERSLVISRLAKTPPSNILPFRYISAYNAAPEYEYEIDQALQKSMKYQRPLEGRTVLLIDVSYSMTMNLSNRSDMTRMGAASGLAIIIANLCSDLVITTFSYFVEQVPARRTIRLSKSIWDSQPHQGTRLGEAIEKINFNYEYDRLIVITDEQSHDKVRNPKGIGYMINVASNQNGVGYSPWIHIDGFSEAAITFIQEYESEIGEQA